MSKFEQSPTLLGTDEAAERLNRHPRSVTRLAKEGRIPATKLPGRTGAYVFTEADVQAFLEAEKAES